MTTFRNRISEVMGSDFTPNERLVLIVWLSHANPEGVAWPSMSRLASLTGLSARSVRRSIRVARDVGTLTELGRRHGALVLRYRSCPQRSHSPRTPEVIVTGPGGHSGADTVSYKQTQENKLSRTSPYPNPFRFAAGQRDQVQFILEWADDVGVDEAWWDKAVDGHPGVVHQVSRAMEASQREGGYRGSRRYRWLRDSLIQAASMRG